MAADETPWWRHWYGVPEWASNDAPLRTQRKVGIVALALMFMITIARYIVAVEDAWVLTVLLVVAITRLIYIQRAIREAGHE